MKGCDKCTTDPYPGKVIFVDDAGCCRHCGHLVKFSRQEYDWGFGEVASDSTSNSIPTSNDHTVEPFGFDHSECCP